MKIFDFLLRNPIFLFVLLAWLVPTIGNVLKKAEKARRARGSSPPPPPRHSIPSQAQPLPPRAQPMARSAPARQSPPAAQPAQAKSAEEIAREMRRILGLEAAPPKPAPRPAAQATPPAPPPIRRAPIAAPIERPPQPIQISTRDRKLELHGDSHVGDGIRARHLDKQKRRQPSGGQRLGDLGGRVVAHGQRRRAGSRFALDDLKRAIVLSEILAPPVALRPFEERRGH
ncbi:MAG: hypothetical protein H6835_12490 [Planctomycetes bacterium]|nr:hypothetical protein [Planctomycetota bacterium]